MGLVVSSGGGGGLWLWLWLMVEVVVDGAGLFFLGSGIYYFIVGDILFYCDVYIILLC